MAKTELSKDEDGHYLIFCPACGTHGIPTKQRQENGAMWTFNGDLQRPTFAPSVNIEWGGGADENGKTIIVRRCHFFIQDGIIKFQVDCTHDWRGIDVELLDIEYANKVNHYINRYL